MRLSEEEYNDEFQSITDVLAKLQKIIVQNKHTMADLQEELKEYKGKAKEASSPDPLSRSWGGHSWNSMELQKELCRNCKQAKWQRILMGSFDLVDSTLEIKQDEVERFVEKLSVDDESKCRKKHSLKDSLELADNQLEHLQRLSRQEHGSLDTLGEDSSEECYGESEEQHDVIDGLGSPEVVNNQSNSNCDDDTSCNWNNSEVENEQSHAQSPDDKNSTSKVEEDCTENLDESWKNIHVSPRLCMQYSILSDPEPNVVNLRKKESEEEIYVETDSVETNDTSLGLELISEEEDDDEKWLIDEGSIEHEEDDDRVHVVNLYRSIIFENDGAPPKDIFHGKKKESGEENSEEIGNNQSTVPSDVHYSIPEIIIEKDCNDNFLESFEQENYVEEHLTDKPSQASETPNKKYDGESSVKNGEYFDKLGKNSDESSENHSNVSVIKDKKIPNNKSDLEQMPRNKVSESWSISAEQKNSVFEFVGNFGDERESQSCNHCSENFENFKAKLTEIISNQRKDQESQIFRELEEAKSEFRELQQEYENLEKICEEYRNYVDEYSENLKRKNEELRKLKLNSGIMKTENEWLRQAVGITRNYTEF